METHTREALTRKTLPDLRHIIRRLGGDAPDSEGKESLVNRILLFAPQKWEKEKPKIRHPIVPVTEQQLITCLKPYMLRGLNVKIKDGCWFISIKDRKDSGTMLMPLTVIERTAKYLMPKDC